MYRVLLIAAVLALFASAAPAHANCRGGVCARPALVQGQPARNLARLSVRVASLPVRAVVKTGRFFHQRRPLRRALGF
jgi:hypothetical protein